jgi:hypothetical protein
MQFKPVARDRLYYDRWLYGMSFYLPEVSCLRELNHEAIDQTLNSRRRWRQIQQQRWQRGQTILVNTLRYQDITEQMCNNLHRVAAVLLEHVDQFKLVVSINTAWIYTNSQDLLQQLADLPCVADATYTQAKINKPRDVVVLQNSKYNYRSYFRSKKLSLQQKKTLVQFLENHQKFVRISPSLEQWTDNMFFRSQDYFFIDHKDMSWLTMLSLVCPNIIRKTMQIQQAK